MLIQSRPYIRINSVYLNPVLHREISQFSDAAYKPAAVLQKLRRQNTIRPRGGINNAWYRIARAGRCCTRVRPPGWYVTLSGDRRLAKNTDSTGQRIDKPDVCLFRSGFWVARSGVRSMDRKKSIAFFDFFVPTPIFLTNCIAVKVRAQ